MMNADLIASAESLLSDLQSVQCEEGILTLDDVAKLLPQLAAALAQADAAIAAMKTREIVTIKDNIRALEARLEELARTDSET